MFCKFFVWIVLGFNFYDIGEIYFDFRYICFGFYVFKEIFILNMYILCIENKLIIFI